MEDGRCLLDVINDPNALNAFLQQDHENKHRLQTIQRQNVTQATSINQPGASQPGHQFIVQQQQPQNVRIIGSPMPPPSISPMAPSPMNHPVGSPLVPQGSPLVAQGSPLMVARSPLQQPHSPQVQQTVLQQVPSPINAPRTNSPLMFRSQQILPKPVSGGQIVQQQTSLGQPTVQLQKGQNVVHPQSHLLPMQVQSNVATQNPNPGKTVHYQPQTTAVISSLQNTTPVNLQGSTILQTSTGKYLLPSGIRLQNLQQFITSQSAAGQVVVPNNILQTAATTGNVNNLVNYSSQPGSQIAVIQGATNTPQAHNLILRTLPSLLQVGASNANSSVQNGVGQKTLLIAPQQNLAQIQATANAVQLNQTQSRNLLPKTIQSQNGNLIVNVGGQNINLQQIKNLQTMGVAGNANLGQVTNASKFQPAISTAQAGGIVMSNAQQVTTLANPAAQQTLNVGGQIYLNSLSSQSHQKVVKGNPPQVQNVVSNTPVTQMKLNAKLPKKQIHIQRAGDHQSPKPGSENSVGAVNQTMTSLSAAQAQADNILSQAISICNLELDSTDSSKRVQTAKQNYPKPTVAQGVPSPVPVTHRITTCSAASNVSNGTSFSNSVPPVVGAGVPRTFSPSATNTVSVQLPLNSFQSHPQVQTVLATATPKQNTQSSAVTGIQSNVPQKVTTCTSKPLVHVVKPVLAQSPVTQCAQTCSQTSTAITTIAVSQITQCPTISSTCTNIPISSVIPPSQNPAIQNQKRNIQLALQTIQNQMKVLLAKKDRTLEEETKLQKFNEAQRRIMSYAQPQTLPLVTPVTDVKTALAGIQNMHNVTAPNVTIVKSDPKPVVNEVNKPSVIPATVKVITQSMGGAKVQTIAHTPAADGKEVATSTPVTIGSHVINLNLTPSQKVKFEEQLKKLTPEQQEVFAKHQTNLTQLIQQRNLMKQQQQGVKPGIQIKQERTAAIPVPTVSVNVTVQQVAPGINQIKPILTTSTPVTLFTSDRGIKRIATGAISKTSLLSQQLRKDQLAVIAPECKTQFTNSRDACRRLLRYHVFHDKDPPSYIRQKEEDNFEEYASDLLDKGRRMLSWYQNLLLDESTRTQPTSEVVMMERMFLQAEREKLAEDKKLCEEDPDKFIPTPITETQAPNTFDVSTSTPLPPTSSTSWLAQSSPKPVQSNVNIPVPANNFTATTNQSSTSVLGTKTEPPKLGVRLIIKRNSNSLSGGSYVTASPNPGSESPSMPKDYEDFRTSINSDQYEKVEPASSSARFDSGDSVSDFQYTCRRLSATEFDVSTDYAGRQESVTSQEMDVTVSGADDTLTEDDLSQSEDVLAVDSLLHSDMEMDQTAIEMQEDQLEIPDFFPDQDVENQHSLLRNELDELNSFEEVMSPYDDDSQNNYSIDDDLQNDSCVTETENTIEDLLTNVPSFPNAESPDASKPGAVGAPPIDEGVSICDVDVELSGKMPDDVDEGAMSSFESCADLSLSKPEAPVSVDSGLQSGGFDNNTEPIGSVDYLSDISDVEEEEDLTEQMQSTIDSILSLQQGQMPGGMFQWPGALSLATAMPMVDGLPQSAGDEIEDDLDAAVQSIL